MKKKAALLAFVWLLLFSAMFGAQFVEAKSWSTAEVVSTESTEYSVSPSLAVDSGDNVHVAWYDSTNYAGAGTDYDIFYKNRTSSWSTTDVVSTESTGQSRYPSLAVDSGGNVHVAWDDYTDYAGSGTDQDIFYKNRTSSWSSTDVVSTESTGASFRPSLAVDSGGNVHVAWEDSTDYAGAGTDSDIFYKNRTSSWSSTDVVSTESTGISKNPSLAVDSGGNVHVAWDDSTDYAGSGTDVDIFYKRYEVGVGWSTTEVVSTESTGYSYRPSLAVDSGDNVHVAWRDSTDYAGAGTDYDIFYKNRTSSWSSTDVVSTESTGTSWYLSLAVDSGGNVHVAWGDSTDYAGSGTDQDIFYKNRMSSWSSTDVVSTESTGGSGSPSLAVNSSGNVHVAWNDNTDYAGAGTDLDIFYKRSEVSPPPPPVGGIWITPNKLQLLAPWIALATTIISAIAVTAVILKHRKKQ